LVRHEIVTEEEEPAAPQAEAVADHVLGDATLFELREQADWAGPEPQHAVGRRTQVAAADLLVVTTPAQKQKNKNKNSWRI
jgi:NAD(P)H-dependent FMN reductase